MSLPTLILTAAAALLGLWFMVSKNLLVLKVAKALCVAAMLVQFGWLILEGRSFQYFPLIDAWGVMVVVAIVLITVSGVLSLRYHFPWLLVGVLFMLGITLVLARIFFPRPGLDGIKLDSLLGVHVLVSSVGFSVLAVGCVSGILILVRSRVLKSDRWSTGSNTAWPSLTSLDRLFVWSMGLGILVLTTGIVLGFYVVPEVHLKGPWYLDPKVILSSFGWAIYGGVWAARKMQGFFSRSMVAAATLGYICVLLGFFLSNLFATGFHRF
jgi:ABC-type uncharacterized transport system permease subunit